MIFPPILWTPHSRKQVCTCDQGRSGLCDRQMDGRTSKTKTKEDAPTTPSPMSSSAPDLPSPRHRSRNDEGGARATNGRHSPASHSQAALPVGSVSSWSPCAHAIRCEHAHSSAQKIQAQSNKCACMMVTSFCVTLLILCPLNSHSTRTAISIDSDSLIPWEFSTVILNSLFSGPLLWKQHRVLFESHRTNRSTGSKASSSSRGFGQVAAYLAVNRTPPSMSHFPPGMMCRTIIDAACGSSRSGLIHGETTT